MKPECFLRGKSENYRFFFGFLTGGATIGLFLNPITSCMTLLATWEASPFYFFFGLIKGGLACCNITIAGLTKSVVKQHTLNIYYSPA